MNFNPSEVAKKFLKYHMLHIIMETPKLIQKSVFNKKCYYVNLLQLPKKISNIPHCTSGPAFASFRFKKISIGNIPSEQNRYPVSHFSPQDRKTKLTVRKQDTDSFLSLIIFSLKAHQFKQVLMK